MEQKDKKEPSELTRLYYFAEQCDATLPHGVARKIEILAQIQVILGRYASDAVRDYKHVYAKRKLLYAEASIAAKRDKPHQAELAIADLRIQEADLEADKVRWENAVKSNMEVINSLKYTLKTMLAENPERGG